MKEILERVSGLHARIANDAFGDRGVLTCDECGFSRTMKAAEGGEYLARGWPKHCGHTLKLTLARASGESPSMNERELTDTERLDAIETWTRDKMHGSVEIGFAGENGVQCEWSFYDDDHWSVDYASRPTVRQALDAFVGAPRSQEKEKQP